MERRPSPPITPPHFVSASFAGALALAALPAVGLPLDPSDFASLGLLNGSAITLDSSALTVDGSAGGVLVAQGSGLPDIAVFTFDGGSTLGDVIVSGLNPIAILFRGSATITGQIDLSGTGTIGVAGGANGGAGGSSAENGEGPGHGLGGSTSASTSGIGAGSGGGFGTDGESGGASVTFRAGGAAYGDPLSVALQAGSGGGGGGWGNTRRGGNGGAGGGALEIGALTSLLFDGASITSDGADGTSNFAGGGGGSGGGLFFHAFDIGLNSTSILTANGGNGGNFGASGNQGGCGGAGRIQISLNTAGSYSNQGTVEAISGSGSAFCDQSGSGFSVTRASDIGVPDTQAVPLPTALAMFASGFTLLGLLGWKRRRSA